MLAERQAYRQIMSKGTKNFMVEVLDIITCARQEVMLFCYCTHVRHVGHSLPFLYYVLLISSSSNSCSKIVRSIFGSMLLIETATMTCASKAVNQLIAYHLQSNSANPIATRCMWEMASSTLSNMIVS